MNGCISTHLEMIPIDCTVDSVLVCAYARDRNIIMARALENGLESAVDSHVKFGWLYSN